MLKPFQASILFPESYGSEKDGDADDDDVDGDDNDEEEEEEGEKEGKKKGAEWCGYGGVGWGGEKNG